MTRGRAGTGDGQNTLTVLGCDGSYPGPGGAASGYLVSTATTTVLLDAGPGTFANLQRHASPADLDAVVLTHEHPDHWSDLESLAVWCLLADVAGIPVYAPPSLRARSYFAEHPVLDWREADPDERPVVGDLVCRFARTDHGPPTMAVRLDQSGPAATGGPADAGRALGYTADTGPDWSVAELGSGLGTVLSEATFTREREGSPHHLSGRQAGAMAAAARVGTLVVTHRWPTVSADALRDEASVAFGRVVAQAATDAVFGW